MPKQGRHTDFWCSGSNQSTEGAARNFLSGSFWVSYPSRTGCKAEECASILPESKALSLSWTGGKRMPLDRSKSNGLYHTISGFRHWFYPLLAMGAVHS